ncbi:CoA-binding protein, partial [Kineococcus siccus]|uniref:CoA-binding protein n=1 Tax=Kineococcus siccus TaxID=2696567 RepID=UPI0030B816B9
MSATDPTDVTLGSIGDTGTVAAQPSAPAAPATSSHDAPVDGSAGAWTAPRPGERLRILRRSRTVAVVGASNKSSRASYFVSTYLLASSDFEVWFVNPHEETILGRPAH